jgi:hypothetical protein
VNMNERTRYDTSEPLIVPEPQLIFGQLDLHRKKAIDLVFVADGFTAADMGDFRVIVNAFHSEVATHTLKGVNEPLFSFASVIRIWTIELPSTDPTKLVHRVVAATMMWSPIRTKPRLQTWLAWRRSAPRPKLLAM